MKKIFLFCLLVAFNIQGFSQSLNMSLVGSYHSSWNNSRGSDVCGWVDGNGTEYALVGLRDRFSVINLSNPSLAYGLPILVEELTQMPKMD